MIFVLNKAWEPRAYTTSPIFLAPTTLPPFPPCDTTHILRTLNSTHIKLQSTYAWYFIISPPGNHLALTSACSAAPIPLLGRKTTRGRLLQYPINSVLILYSLQTQRPADYDLQTCIQRPRSLLLVTCRSRDFTQALHSSSKPSWSLFVASFLSRSSQGGTTAKTDSIIQGRLFHLVGAPITIPNTHALSSYPSSFHYLYM